MFICFLSPVESDIADFDGRSSLLYRFNQKLMSTFKDVVSLKFKSMQGDGVLFHGEGQRGDYITLELQKGKLSLHINLGMFKHFGIFFSMVVVVIFFIILSLNLHILRTG